MRTLFSGLVAAGLLISPFAAAQCVRPADNSAFEVTGLKTRLMVTALTCQANDKYDAFIVKYRPELVNQDRALNGYFSRVHGRNSSKQRDDYVTQLANSESQVGTRQGSLFCNQNLPIFEEVMQLRSTSELPAYAGAKSVSQPVAVAGCAAASVTPSATTRRSASRRR